MKIAQVTPSYPPYRGGTGNVAWNYTERLRQRGHDVQVFTPRFGNLPGDPPYVHRLQPLARLGMAFFVPSIFNKLTDFDLVHLHYPFFGGAETVALHHTLKRKQPLVMTYHMDPLASGMRGALFAIYRRTFLPLVLRRAQRVLVSSHEYFKASQLAGKSGVADCLEVHPFGIDTDHFKPGPEKTLSTGEVQLLFVGGLDKGHYFKGLDILLDALAAMTNRSWRLQVVGQGELLPNFKQQAERNGIARRVEFNEDVSDQDLPGFYQRAHLHLFPSTGRSEAFGLVALEAAACGTACLAANLPGVRSVVRHGETGMLVPPGDREALTRELDHLLAAPDLLAELGRNGRARAETEFSWAIALERLEQTYREVLGTH